MKKKLNWIIFGVVLVVIIGGSIAYSSHYSSKPGKYDSLAICLKDKGVKFYGAWWCPHCKAQKAFFGNSAKLLPYVECSTPDGNNQLTVCKDANIQSYPTWVFADGSILNGEVQPKELADKAGCELPSTTE